MRRKRRRRVDTERGNSKIERKVWTGCKDATNKEQHRRHFYRLFSLVLRIRSRDRARNDITALYELHLRNAGMPTNLHRCSSSEWFSGRNEWTRHARKVPSNSFFLVRSFSRSTLVNRTPMTTLFIVPRDHFKLLHERN